MVDTDDVRHLVGREEDARLFGRSVRNDELVILTGESGVGKSSLLNLKLVPYLRRIGLYPMVCNDWTSTSDALAGPAQFLAGKLRSQFPDGIDRSSTRFVEELSEQYPDQAVLILDQFEELIRYQPELFSRIVSWVEGVVQDYRVRIVLSLRAEYEHRLRSVNLAPFMMSRYPLRPLSELKDVEAVIRSGNRSDAVVIDDAAIELMLDCWKAARADRAWSEVGLLHLQATLYVLSSGAAGPVEREQIEQLIEEAGSRAGIFEVGLTHAVRLKLERCLESCSSPQLPVPVDDLLARGTCGLIPRIAGQLSSGGYKLVRDRWDLARLVLVRELQMLDLPDATVNALFRAFCDLVDSQDEESVSGELPLNVLSVPRAEIERAAGVPHPGGHSVPELAERGVDPVPWRADPDDVSSGPMLGMSPVGVLVEEFRRFFFAIEWLRTAYLIRTTSPVPGQTMVSLIHDGFAAGLQRWAAVTGDGPSEALAVLTAMRGESLNWQDDASDDPVHAALDGGQGFRIITNVRWRNCRISASFRHVVMVNCDFRGSQFRRCGFRGVVFVNCLLDGVTFSGCTIYGAVEEPYEQQTREELEELPPFLVDIPAEAVRTLNVYRETDVVAGQLFSVTSGVPAVPWNRPVEGTVRWDPQSGGMTMYGGRLSSLLVRDCRFEDGGTLAFRHVAGSSLEIAEQAIGRFEFYGAAIRGLSVTRTIGETEASGGDIRIRMQDSLIANAWFGPSLIGDARFTKCVVWQLFNASTLSSFGVELRNSRHHGLVNVHQPDGPPEEGLSTNGLGADEVAVVAAGLRMDYRSRPARLELTKEAFSD